MFEAAVYLSTSCFGNVPLADALRLCQKNRIFHVELSGPHPFEPVQKVRSILAGYRQKGFSFTVHNYFPPQSHDFILNIASLDSNIRAKTECMVGEALTIAEEVGSPIYGIHSGYLSDGKVGSNGIFIFSSRKQDVSASLRQASGFIDSLIKKNNRISIILENLFPAVEENHSLACTVEEIKELLSLLPEEAGLLLDLGHLSITSRMLGFDKFLFLEKYLRAFGVRVREVHISENSGLRDEHLPLSEDSWQLKALSEINSIPVTDALPRVFCLEARNSSDMASLKSSIELIRDNVC
ncbi:MAG TPA: hypothetical protein DCL49_13150 [Candidatus Omnitrophica bacterium]|nr:hypothetical protein [Candidatus Omnitrophota bacterium]